MIIQCVNCNKKFEVDSSLIPESGRSIQCGSCSHTWYYKPNLEIKTDNVLINEASEQTPEVKNYKKDEFLENKEKNNNLENKTISKTNKSNIKKISKKTSDFKITHIFSYLIVLIISLISLIIVLDTFKSPLSGLFPNIELLLFNLFESLKDIKLFIKDLMV